MLSRKWPFSLLGRSGYLFALPAEDRLFTRGGKRMLGETRERGLNCS